MLKRMCEQLGISHYVVSAENHDGILCERFHRYLNKVQKIHAADSQTTGEWQMGTVFAC
jgi:hypothetical protein